MPKATSFTALADGDGGLCFVPAYNCTIGQKDGSQSNINEDYITLGGHRGSTGGTASQTQIKNSFINAMKMYWNFHGISVSGGLTEASASSSRTFTQSYTKVEPGDPDPIRTPLNWSISTSATANASKSFPNVDITSTEPIAKVCGSGSSLSTFSVDEGEDDSDLDTGEDTSGGITIYSQSRANVTFGGVGVGPPYGYFFSAGGPRVRAFFDNGLFVGYGVTGLIDSANYSVDISASGGFSDQPNSNASLISSFSLGGVTYEGSVAGLNPDNIETKKITLDGIPLLFQAGYYDDPAYGDIQMSISGNTASFVGTGSSLDGNVQTITLPDTSSRENYVSTSTVTNQSSFKFKFKIDDLEFYTY